MTRAIITGGAGFIGSHLCERLLEMGWKVVCVDNLYTGSIQNIKHLLDKKNFTFVETDVERFWDKGKPDYIFHLASPASPKDYMLLSEETLSANTIGTYKMLHMAGHIDATMIYASTSEVYGDPLEHPQKETYYGNVNSFGSRSCYDEGKRCGEAFCKVFSDTGVNVKVARIFNTYGPRMRENDGRVIPNFITQALRGDPLTIYGGDQTRSFCFVDDMVEGLIKIALEGKNGEVYNVGNPNEMRISKLASTINFNMGLKNEATYTDMPMDDPKRRCPDITKIKKIGWKPTTNLEDGLKKTIEYFKKETSYQTGQKLDSKTSSLDPK